MGPIINYTVNSEEKEFLQKAIREEFDKDSSGREYCEKLINLSTKLLLGNGFIFSLIKDLQFEFSL